MVLLLGLLTDGHLTLNIDPFINSASCPILISAFICLALNLSLLGNKIVGCTGSEKKINVSKSYSELSQAFKMKLYAKSSILDVYLDSKYALAVHYV